MSEFFQKDKSLISCLISHALEEGALSQNSVGAKIATTAADEKIYQANSYNLGVIIAVSCQLSTGIKNQTGVWF